MRESLRAVTGLREHPAAPLVPTMTLPEYEAFKADLAANGIQQPLEISEEGVVLDGRHRLQAARELGLERVPVRIVETTHPAEYMLRSALQRRHLSQSQKACLAVELISLGQVGELVAMLPPGSRSRDLVARIAGACPRTSQDVLTVHAHDPDLFQRIRAGEIPAHKARQQLERAQRYAQIGEAPPLPPGLFDLIYADPPWQLGNPDSPFAPEQHYPTQPLDEIKALPLPAAENAVLFLWVPTSLLREGLEVIEAWSFEYRTELVWDKGSIGPGQWLRNQHEPLLIASRGSQSPPEPTRRAASVVRARRRGHSTKPLAAYELIERMYPHARRLELYARGRPRPGWTTWGNQLEQEETP
jgi:N6-adenosine-specific RNA methylase IME4